MISDPNLILYACIAKNSTILADFTRESDLQPIAKQCLENTPKFHSIFSQTINRKSYMFLIDDPFVFFAMYNDNLPKTEALFFLDRVKCAFHELSESGVVRIVDLLEEKCLQGRFKHVFKDVLALELDFGSMGEKGSRNLSMDSVKEGGGSISPLLGVSSKALLKKKKKKRRLGGDDDVNESSGDGKVGGVDDHEGEGRRNWLCREVLLNVFRVGRGGNDLQTAKKVWRRHLMVVLVLDFVVCVVMFAIWLSVCQGFKCIG